MPPPAGSGIPLTVAVIPYRPQVGRTGSSHRRTRLPSYPGTPQGHHRGRPARLLLTNRHTQGNNRRANSGGVDCRRPDRKNPRWALGSARAFWQHHHRLCAALEYIRRKNHPRTGTNRIPLSIRRRGTGCPIACPASGIFASHLPNDVATRPHLMHLAPLLRLIQSSSPSCIITTLSKAAMRRRQPISTDLARC